MPSKLTPLGWTFKWVVMPLAVAGAGYIIAGELLGAPPGSRPSPPDSQRRPDAMLPSASDQTGASEMQAIPIESQSGPEVLAHVKPLNHKAPRPKIGPRSATSHSIEPMRAKPLQTVDPPADEGGSAGAATGG